ncbi:MAG: ABC transporter ATP-binding protein [Candidatus Eisenbacteria bacterium]|nr:ABC transporter ATP-binding protein [Candidatus Eisenbacteria bacterium]
MSFTAEAGQAWAVLGPNGSGKSTLLKVLAGLLRPSKGTSELILDGVRMPGPERRVALGLVSPEISSYEELTGLENLDFAARMRGAPHDEPHLLASLEAVGLEKAVHVQAGRYSSGMKQRLKLAMAILHRPALLILDEPMALLDDLGRAKVRSVVADQLTRGIVMWATNDPSELPADVREIRVGG